MKKLKKIGISTIISGSILISCTHMSKKNMLPIAQYNNSLSNISNNSMIQYTAVPSIPLLLTSI